MPTLLRLPAVLLLLVACGDAPDPEQGRGAAAPAVSRPHARSASGLQTSAAEVTSSLERARSWLDALHVDTVELTRNGVKGKKKLGEILAAYWDLTRFSSSVADREQIVSRVRGLAAQTSEPAYHNLVACPDREFRQNSMSYLRVLRLMEEFGLDTSSYRRELEKVKPRLDAHMEQRGPWQRAVFAAYYDRYGLERPKALDGAEDDMGVVGERLAPEKYKTGTAYQVTHQVFAAFDYGNRTAQTRFDEDELAYLRETLPLLARVFLDAGNPDLLAEFLSSMSYLGFTEDPVHAEGLRYLLRTQNPDGSWGTYSRQRYGPFVAQRLTLHTVQVVVHALLVSGGEAVLRPGAARISRAPRA